MNEMEMKFKLPSQYADESGIKKKIYESVNVLQVPNIDGDCFKFAGKTIANQCLVLLTFRNDANEAHLIINCEKIVIGNMLAKEVKKAFEK